MKSGPLSTLIVFRELKRLQKLMHILHACYERLPVNMSSMLLYFKKSDVIFYYIFSQYPPYVRDLLSSLLWEKTKPSLPPLGGPDRDLGKTIQTVCGETTKTNTLDKSSPWWYWRINCQRRHPFKLVSIHPILWSLKVQKYDFLQFLIILIFLRFEFFFCKFSIGLMLYCIHIVLFICRRQLYLWYFSFCFSHVVRTISQIVSCLFFFKKNVFNRTGWIEIG